jgi:hypothetical protein
MTNVIEKKQHDCKKNSSLTRIPKGGNQKTKRKLISGLNATLHAIVVLLVVLLTSCGQQPTVVSEKKLNIQRIVISPTVPKDIFTNGDSASKADPRLAAIFAWQEFIALNWPAQIGYRDSADANAKFGTNPVGTPLVWHTFRHKVEIYPGNNLPPHGYNPASPDYGYNGSTFAPKYLYTPSLTSTPDGQILPFTGKTSTATPWINLDETNEIGVANMFAGAGDADNNGNMMIYLAKANKMEYIYAAKNQWYGGGNGLDSAQARTTRYINKNNNTPQPKMGDSLVSMPYGTIEIKTAWRKLSNSEKSSGRFYTNNVRHYVTKNDTLRYVDEVYGMVALHIIHKTPTAPYFIFATFEQADNLLTTDGKPVEDADGNLIRNKTISALSPAFTVTNAIGSQRMKFSLATVTATPGKSLYYKNTVAVHSDGTPLPDSLQLPQGTVQINKRLNPIPQDIIDINQLAHGTIKVYNSAAVWQYYKLINVQNKPINKPAPGVDYHGSDSANYYQSNSVVESDYVLQKFSGRFYTTLVKGKKVFPNSITDFQDKQGNPRVHNAYNNGRFLMGGCMGCHGNATNGGSDYSFIFGSPVQSPSPTRQITSKEALLKMKKLFKAE